MYKAGYDPHAMLDFMKKLERQSTHRPNLLEDYFDFHPPMDERKQIIIDEYENQDIVAPSTTTPNKISSRIIVKEVCDEDGTGCTSRLQGGKKTIIILGDKGRRISSYSRAMRSARSLNKLFESGIRMYEFKKQNSGGEWSLWVRNVRIARILPGDLEANDESDSEKLLGQWIDNLKLFLWNDFVKDDI